MVEVWVFRVLDMKDFLYYSKYGRCDAAGKFETCNLEGDVH